jgi:hypothetical protein
MSRGQALVGYNPVSPSGFALPLGRIRFCGANGREDAISYARQRAGYAPTEIQVLDNHWSVVETISPETVRGLI